MSEWITDRLPTTEDAVCLFVWTWKNNHAWAITYSNVKPGQPWMSFASPPDYVEPKRVRRRGYLTDDKLIPYGTYIETFADDPADWDALLDAISEYCDQTSESYIPQETKSLFYKMCKALEPKK